MIVIGSTAIKHWYPDFPRKPKDLDYLVIDKTRWERKSGVEYLENPAIWRYVSEFDDYMSPAVLTTLKASHLCWNLNWEKHMWDLQFLLKKGNKIDSGLFKKLYDHWNVVHSKNKRSDLKMTKEDFFTNAVNYDTMQHDEMHKIINSVPMYTRVLRDGAEVELDENKFYALSYEEKLEFVREECYIMAYERYKHLDYRVGFGMMLKKFIISHAPLFSLLFIFENYIELEKCKINYIKVIENGIRSK